MKSRLLLALGSTATLLLLLATAEGAFRLFRPEINFQGIDRHLVREGAFGSTHGWRPDATGVCFGVPASIGPDGFIDLGGPERADSALLLIGDSVVFGVGVPAGSTFAGLLQHRHPGLRVLNTAAVGYAATDYLALAAPMLTRSLPIRRTFLFFSLNDFYGERPLEVRASGFLSFFRRHSRLYLWLKNLLFDRSRRYFEYDSGFYRGPSPDVLTALGRVDSVAALMKEQGIPMTVVLLPYEYQLRATEDGPNPQRVVATCLAARGTHVIDLTPVFARTGESSQSFFLYGDHMHLSARGHEVVWGALERLLASGDTP